MNLTQLIMPLILLIFTFAAGFWVSRSGKPYKAGVFNLHKLLALAAVILSVITFEKHLPTAPLRWELNLLFVLSGLSVIALFATGAVLSIQKTIPKKWQLLHHIAPYLFAASLTAALLIL